MRAWDDVIAAAVAEAARTLDYRAGEYPETQLDAAVRAGLRAQPAARVVQRTPSHPLRNWTRPPGGVDVVITAADGRGAGAAVELKVAKPDESLWDAIKLADVQIAYPTLISAGYLLSTLPGRRTPKAPGSSLGARAGTRAAAC